MAADPNLLSGWERAVFAVVGVFVGFLLNELKSFWIRTRKHRAYWGALRTEVEYARGRAQMYTDDHIMAPLYRLPTHAFNACYPELLADAAVTQEEATALMAFYAEVDTFNRGLERVAKATANDKIEMEYSRNLLKAQQLVADGALYKAVSYCLKRHPARGRSGSASI